MINNCYVKDNIIYLTWSRNGKLYTETSAFKPALYFPTNTESIYKSMDGKSLKKKVYKNILEYTMSLYNLKQKNQEFYGDIDPKYQFIINKFLNKKIEADQIQIYNYDIEAFSLTTDEFQKPEDAKAPVQTITIQEYHTGKYYVYGYRDFLVEDIEVKNDNGELLFIVPKEKIIYMKCRTEIELLRNFVKFLRNKSVQVLTGWNILSYDNQYIYNRLRKLGIEKDFVDSCTEYRGGVNFHGIQNLDYMEIYKKLTNDPKPSYGLEAVSKDELNMSKNEIESFRGEYVNNFQNFIKYNIKDTTLVGKLEDKLQYITLMFAMSSDFRCLPEDILHVTRYWNSYIFSYALERNIIVNSTKDRHKVHYVGAYVKEPKLGKHKWSVMVDIVSSYPRAIRAYNISPETLINYHDLPKDLYKVTTNHLFDIMKDVYKNNKNTYQTESGTQSIITGITPTNKFNILAMNHQFADNSGIMDRIQYPHFIMYDIDREIKESDRIRKIENNKYLFLAEDKKDLIETTNITFKGHKKLVVINHLYLTLGEIEYFSEDHNRFKPFEPLCKKYNYTITPNLQFFKNTKELALLPKTVEIKFFERLKAKNQEKLNASIKYITKEFIDNNCYIASDKLIQYGIKKLPDEDRKRLISVLKTKDITEIDKLYVEAKSLEIIYHIENLSKKIAINGVYGATANEGFRFNDIRICESITSCAQLTLRGCMRYLEQINLIEWLYCDTDSGLFSILNIELNLSDDKQCYETIVKAMKDVIDPAIKNYDKLLMDICNIRNIPVEFEREAIVKSGVFTGKKHYFWHCYEYDGRIFDGEPKYKTRGLDTRKSSTPKWVSNVLESFLIKVIKDKDQKHLMDYIKSAKKHFMGLEFEDIAKSTSASKLSKYKGEMKTALLPHYKGAMTFNKWLKEFDKEKKYEEIKSGKVKWCYVKKNKYGTNALSLSDKYPKEILNDFEIDYEEQFRATVMGMVGQVFKACNWSLDDRKRVF